MAKREFESKSATGTAEYRESVFEIRPCLGRPEMWSLMALSRVAMLCLPYLKRHALELIDAAFPTARKHRAELNFWNEIFAVSGGSLWNGHFEPLLTTVYDLAPAEFRGKRILDVGCGPCGSLEWATMAAERIGLDPLARKYKPLGIDKHAMRYIRARSERIPFSDGHFDIVSSLNALDYADNFDRTIAEIKRVTRKGGLFLVSVEIDHPPTVYEPLSISERDMAKLAPEFNIISAFKVGTPGDHDLHGAVLCREPAYQAGKPGVYVAKMQRL
jgi:SAM-dependent methyltransferase